MAQLFATEIYTTIWTLPTTLTWLFKLPNRIRALLPNLALGMKTHNALRYKKDELAPFIQKGTS